MKKTEAYMYLRLSRDDGDEGESNSIGNQRELIKSYADKAGFEIIKEYIDDGFTGSNFERPNFKKMLSDLEKKSCKTIIVKDLSRFGRDESNQRNYRTPLPERRKRQRRDFLRNLRAGPLAGPYHFLDYGLKRYFFAFMGRHLLAAEQGRIRIGQ
jgi:hypothetical protein